MLSEPNHTEGDDLTVQDEDHETVYFMYENTEEKYSRFSPGLYEIKFLYMSGMSSLLS